MSGRGLGCEASVMLKEVRMGKSVVETEGGVHTDINRL